MGIISGAPLFRYRRGFTFLEVMIALAILAVAAMGTLGTLVAIQQHNQSASDATLGYKACQDVMEQLVAMSYDTMKLQDGVTFVAKQLHPTALIGLITITDISPPSDPDTKSQIQVSVISQGAGAVGLKPINVKIVSWRSRR